MIAHSYSSLTKFETCPYQYFRVRVAKDVVEPPNEAAEWGTRVHLALEERVRDKKPLPSFAAEWEPLAAKFDPYGDRVFCEAKFGLTRTLEACDFFASDCWYRGVVDVGVHGTRALLGDYKTGKIKENHDQLKLFAAAHMATYPTVESCLTKYYWLKFKMSSKLEVHRDDLPAIWSEFLPRFSRLEAAYEKEKWPCKPSGLCRGWCPVRDCEHWRPRTR